jgi:hypothetical protein
MSKTKSKRSIPDWEDGNPFLDLGTLLMRDISVATLATAIDRHGIYLWDRFGRFKHVQANDPLANKAFDLLALMYDWELQRDDPHVSPLSPPEDMDLSGDIQYLRFGWAAEVVPNFNEIDESPPEPGRKFAKRKAPDGFIKALVRLLIDIAKRDKLFDVDEMSGIKKDFYELARKIDVEFKLEESTFDTYINGICKFKQGSRSGTYYKKLFPELFK